MFSIIYHVILVGFAVLQENHSWPTGSIQDGGRTNWVLRYFLPLLPFNIYLNQEKGYLSYILIDWAQQEMWGSFCLCTWKLFIIWIEKTGLGLISMWLWLWIGKITDLGESSNSSIMGMCCCQLVSGCNSRCWLSVGCQFYRLHGSRLHMSETTCCNLKLPIWRD